MKKGATLIELLVAIAIIGIVTSMIIASKEKANTEYVIQNNRGINYFVEKYDEEDGCVTFESYKKDVKLCGNYSITQQ